LSRSVGIVLGLALALAGCAAEAPQVELGTGLEAFRPLHTGDTVDLVLGPQGGQHIVGNARIVGLAAGQAAGWQDDPLISFRVHDASGVQWDADLAAQPREFVAMEEGGHCLRRAQYVYLRTGAPEALDGREVELRVEVEDRDGVRVTDARRVRVQGVVDPGE